jgi:hypothetical protein
MSKDELKGLELLRAPFPAHQISKLPKPTKKQTEDRNNRIRCQVCGGWHHPNVIHLDYVGHAALTDRLLDVDPNWNWEPFSTTESGLPCFDNIGGLWIKLTILGVTRLGYGHADDKKGGNAIKEVIGDALRNAAMRFGAALDLWHKGDLHGDDDEPEKQLDKPKHPIADKEKPPLPEGRVVRGQDREFLRRKASPQDAIEEISRAYTLSDDDIRLINETWEEEHRG